MIVRASATKTAKSHYRSGPTVLANYRAATATLTSSTQTFTCAACGKFKAIVGRTLLRMIGRRKFYQCAQCTVSEGGKCDVDHRG